MTTQHLFLSSAAAPLPARLRQAFEQLQELAAAQLQARCADLPAGQTMVWLSSADAQWPVYLRQVLQAQPGARVVLLSNAPEALEGLTALNAGVRGYTHAYGVPALLQEVALVVEHGGLWVGPDLLQRLVGSTQAALAGRAAVDKARAPAMTPAATPASALTNAWSLLSAREAQVARAVAAGRSNREVAALLFISERTVKAHMGAVFEKLGVRDRLQLVLHLSVSADPAPAPNSEPSA